MQLAFILGRTPRLAYKEIEAAATILPFQWSLSMVHPQVALLKAFSDNVDGSELPGLKTAEILPAVHRLQARLGGTLRIVRVRGRVERGELVGALSDYLRRQREERGQKLSFGLSLYGQGVGVTRLGLAIKKGAGSGLRAVLPRGEKALSTAQILHNRLVGEGIDLVLISQGGFFLWGESLTVQDIDSYAKRDYSVPVPDPVSGMLPPKLAQTLINLALGNAPLKDAWLYDPFCGNGRVVQEAWLMGLPACGSDLVAAKVEASRRNLAWLAAEYRLELPPPEGLFWVQDATMPQAPARLSQLVPADAPLFIACEPYLGPPLRQPLTAGEKVRWQGELSHLYLDFFAVWAAASHRPRAMAVVFPKARLAQGGAFSLYGHLVDRLGAFGYSTVQVSDYGRPDALVTREIVLASF